MEQRKQVSLNQLLTDKELARASGLYKQLKDSGKYAATICKELVEPNMQRINAATGQENNAKYIAYMVEYVMSRMSGEEEE